MSALLSDNYCGERYGVKFRLVQESDAEFIVRLRTDPKNSPFMHIDGLTVDSQREWIKHYKERENKGLEYYFVFEVDDIPVGVNRLYHINDYSFHCGSWVFDRNLPPYYSLAGGIIPREIAFEELNLKVEDNGKDGVISTNKNVINFVKMLGIKFYGERHEGDVTLLNGLIYKDDFEINKRKILRFIPNAL